MSAARLTRRMETTTFASVGELGKESATAPHRTRRTTKAMGGKPASNRTERQGQAPEQPPRQQDQTAWAADLAATLPPLTEAQVAAVGRIATQIDTRSDHDQAV